MHRHYCRLQVALTALCMLLLLGSHAARAQVTLPFPYPFPADFPDFRVDHHWTMPLDERELMVSGATSRGMGVVRLDELGRIDRAFGTNGLAELLVWGEPAWTSVVTARLPDGSRLVAGSVQDSMVQPGCGDEDPYAVCNVHIALFRLDVAGRQDLSFNRYGRLVLRVGGQRTPPGQEDGNWAFVAGVDVEHDGTILVHAVGAAGPVARVLPDGTLDTSFRGTEWTGVEHDFVSAVGLYNSTLDQYFTTSGLAEVAGLDRDPLTGWSRTFGSFHVYPAGWSLTPTVPVCRFWRRPDAGGGAHVLSAHAGECAALAADPNWILESREVFRVLLPDAASGACPDGHAPVYRLWNGRADGGHHLTSSRRTRDYLLGKGYVAEGWGPLGVAMCAAP